MLTYADTRFESIDPDIETEEKIPVRKNGWLTVLLIATLAPLLAGIVSVIFDLIPSSLGPTLPMNITCKISDNPCVVIPAGESSLDNSECIVHHASRIIHHSPFITHHTTAYIHICIHFLFSSNP